MNKKTLLYGLFIAGISLILAYVSIISQNISTSEDRIGDFVFEKTNQEGTKIQQIIIKMPKLQISLYYQDKFWHIKEADGYFADLVTVNKLFQDINRAKIEAINTEVSIEEASLEQPQNQSATNAGIEIQTYNDKGQMLDSVIIGARRNNFLYARFPDKQQVYLISGDFDFSDKIYYWLQQPLISIMPKNIESVIIQTDTGQQVAFRTSERSPFYNLKQEKTNIQPLLERFVLFNCREVKKLENTPLYNQTADKTIVLFPYSGLIYAVGIYKIEEDYWAKIDLSISKLPTKIARDYIKDSAILYKNWAFKLDKRIGQYLWNYTIN